MNDWPSGSVPEGSIGIVDALVNLGLVGSKGEARRLIKGGGARIEGEKVSDEGAIVAVGDAPVKLSAGKKAHGVLVR